MKVKELKTFLSTVDDNDVVVVEVFDTVLYEDLYEFTLDIIERVETIDGIVKEIRICPTKI